MTVRSNPPGAFLYVDNYPIGTTPVSTDFTYYGKRQFRLVRDGYETLTVEQRVWPPWYEWFGIDFVSENLIPYTFRDERQLSFQMIPQQIPPSPQLAARAEELAHRARRSATSRLRRCPHRNKCQRVHRRRHSNRHRASCRRRRASRPTSCRRRPFRPPGLRPRACRLPPWDNRATRCRRLARPTLRATYECYHRSCHRQCKEPHSQVRSCALATRFERRTGTSHYFSAAILDRSEASSRQSRTSNASLAQRLAATAYRAAW